MRSNWNESASELWAKHSSSVDESYFVPFREIYLFVRDRYRLGVWMISAGEFIFALERFWIDGVTCEGCVLNRFLILFNIIQNLLAPNNLAFCSFLSVNCVYVAY